ncbi:MAG TPA: hypothetical protein PKA58_00940 [Polyangium sp.]|nr:hypothetical protein [Polyangium sp.]
MNVHNADHVGHRYGTNWRDQRRRRRACARIVNPNRKTPSATLFGDGTARAQALLLGASAGAVADGVGGGCVDGGTAGTGAEEGAAEGALSAEGAGFLAEAEA